MDTQAIFSRFLSIQKPQVIFDIGSRDGTEASKFKRLSPTSKVIAFEANPELIPNFKDKLGISVHNLAVSNFEGPSTFKISDLTHGCGSLREDTNPNGKEINVTVTTLDTFVKSHDLKGSFALWIDVEGCTNEVLEGGSKSLSNVSIIHAEVESRELWKNQSTFQDVSKKLQDKGFIQLCSSMNDSIGQGNAIFINKNEKVKLEFKAWFAYMQLKKIAKKVLRPSA